MKKIYSIILCLIIMSAFSFSVFAQNVGDVFYYDSYIPEPVITDNCKTFVVFPSSSNSSAVPTLFVFYADSGSDSEFEVYINISSDNKWQYTCTFNYTGTQGSVSSPVLLMYNAVTGEYLGGNYNITLNNTYTTSRTISSWNAYQNYGCTLIFQSSYNVSIGHMQWAYAVQDEWFAYLINTSLSTMLQRLNSIDTSTQSLDYDFYNFLQLFTQYQAWIRSTYYREIQTQSTMLSNIESYLYMIYNKVDDIYELLGGGQEVTTVPPENDSFIDEYNSLENNVMTDYQADAVEVFSYANNISTFGNAFQWLSVSIQQIILNNAKFNTLILFTLGIGIAVLIIGRKINT